MDANLGFEERLGGAQGFWRHKPQMVVHVAVGCQVHYEKTFEKDSQVLLPRDGKSKDFIETFLAILGALRPPFHGSGHRISRHRASPTG